MFAKELTETYNSQARKFSSTRHKHWPEMDHIVEEIEKEIKAKKKINLLELGCGDGRLLKHIEHLSMVSYTGVDMSQGLLDIARKVHPRETFIVEDMIQYLKNTPEASLDTIVAIASMQHLFPCSERQSFFNLAKKVLVSGGKLILINRARSDRAEKKYKRGLRFHILKKITTLGGRCEGDQMIPRKDSETKKTYQRYYHFFTLEEIEGHLDHQWNVQKIEYVTKDGKLTKDVTQARNSLSIITKI